MGNYEQLKTAISGVIKTNGNQEITGAVMQSALLSIINSLGANYQYSGVAKTNTNPGTPDQNIFYLAAEGTYPKFNGLTIESGYIGVLKWNGSWSKETIKIGTSYFRILEYNTDRITTRNQIDVLDRIKGLVISYKIPNETLNNGWVVEQYIADDIPTNVFYGYDSRWNEWNFQQQINEIKSELIFDYKVTYKSNFGTMMLTVPKDIRKQFLVVSYTDNNGDMVRKIRTTPFNQETDGDAGWCVNTAWENLVERKEFSEVQKSVLLMSKTNLLCNITNNSTTGTFDKNLNKLTFSENENPQTSRGLTIEFGVGNYDVINRMKILAKNGIKPNIRMEIERQNMNVLTSVYAFNSKETLTTYSFVSKQVAGQTVYYCKNIDIPEDLFYISFYLFANNKITSGQECSMRIVSADIYYENEIMNNFFVKGDIENLIENHVYFDVEADTSGQKYSRVVDERTALITIPKGSVVGARDIFIPLLSFPQPLSFNELNEVKYIMVKSDGISNFSEINFAEISVEINNVLVNLSKNIKQISINENEVFYVIKLTNTNNYYNQYGYNKVGIRCGFSPKKTFDSDFICLVHFDILGFKQNENLNNELDRIKSELTDIKKSIGTFSSNLKNPYCGIVNKSSNTIMTDKNTVKVENGVSEKNEYVEYLISVARVRAHDIEEPNYTVQLISNKTSSSDINISAEIYAENGLKIQDALVSYDEIYNGVVSINFKLLKQTSEIRYVKLRCTFKTELSNGVSLAFSDCIVDGLSLSQTISEVLYNLQYGNRQIIIQSDSGKKFRLVVSDDGVLSTAPSVPSKMMIMSHSWGLIPYNPQSGWYGNWGLAASTEELDLVHQIETQGKSFNSEFSTFFYRFATFAIRFKDGAPWFETFDCSDLDFDSIFICCFAAGPTDGDWTGFAEALYDCVKNYVCRGKSNIPVYIGYGGGDKTEIEKAAGLFGTQLIDTSDAHSSDGTGWPWLMPAKPDGTRPIKAISLPEGANPENYILNSPLRHPGNWGFYTIAKNLSNQIHTDFNVQNNNPTVLDFNSYKQQPGISSLVDPNYPYSF